VYYISRENPPKARPPPHARPDDLLTEYYITVRFSLSISLSLQPPYIVALLMIIYGRGKINKIK
jgi:hypothetical protein